MPDLTIRTYYMCKSIDGPLLTHEGGYTQFGMFSENTYPQCSCPSYKYGKRTVNFGGRFYPEYCKHIVEAEQKVCGWHQSYSPNGVYVEGSNKCPMCGGPVVTVNVAE